MTLTRVDGCTGKPEPATATFDQLRARIAYVAATKHEQRRDLGDAATQYAAAIAADPTYRPAVIRLAITHLEAGDCRAAVAALAPSLTSAPTATYLDIVTIPELSPLLDAPVAPEIAAVRAAKRGDAVVDASVGRTGDRLLRDRELQRELRDDRRGQSRAAQQRRGAPCAT